MSTSTQSIDTHVVSTKTRNKRFNQHDNEDKIKTKPPMVPIKRKKKISETNIDSSTTAISHTSHNTLAHSTQEILKNKTKAKRQKIENDCNKETHAIAVPAIVISSEMQSQQTTVTSKPPIPPKPDTSIMTQMLNVKQTKIKKKLDETNAAMVVKLNALAEKLRLENADLMKALSNERLAFRTLR